ncbi:MAG: NUDIX domain-containing protein [Candidatus Daviesbacteria bacterium]|nr:NUDIX domain-containing protein [Candidatus Daviesbacteria bacterium]
MKIINKVALAVFKDKKMLQVRTNKQEEVFYTLGGKIEAGESDMECLKREIKEELGCEVDEKSLKYLTHFEDVAHGEQAILHLKMYEGKLIGEPKPSSEIVETGWFDSNSDPKNLSIIARRTIFPWLKARGYIN